MRITNTPLPVSSTPSSDTPTEERDKNSIHISPSKETIMVFIDEEWQMFYSAAVVKELQRQHSSDTPTEDLDWQDLENIVYRKLYDCNGSASGGSDVITIFKEWLKEASSTPSVKP